MCARQIHVHIRANSSLPTVSPTLFDHSLLYPPNHIVSAPRALVLASPTYRRLLAWFDPPPGANSDDARKWLASRLHSPHSALQSLLVDAHMLLALIALGWTAPPSRSTVARRAAAPPRPSSTLLSATSAAPPLEIKVRRTAEGGLGIEVDETNMVASCAGQPDLEVGDRVIAVDGEALGGRYLSQALKPGLQEYSFTVERLADAASMESILARLTAQAEASANGGLDGLATDEVLAGKICKLAAALEAVAEPAAVDDGAMRGFWRLCFAAGEMADGLTGFGAMSSTYAACQFVAFSDSAPRAQVVEVIGDLNLGSTTVAALKGDYELRDEDGAVALACSFDRLEYAGAMQSADVMTVVESVTFVGEQLRLGRCNGELRCYARCDAAAAQTEIGRLLAAPVRRGAAGSDALPRWERADLERGLRGSGPGVEAGGTMM